MQNQTRSTLVLKLIAVSITFSFAVVGSSNYFWRANASESGPPASNTNAPGEFNCTDCHNSFPLNSGIGNMEITGVSTRYQPNQDIPVTVTINDPNGFVFGFQLTAIDSQGRAAGTFTLPTQNPAQMQIVTGIVDPHERKYVEQTGDGTLPSQPGTKSWTFNWTTPSEDLGAITFYAAGNAADGAAGRLGDYIYTTSRVTTTDPPQFDYDGDAKTDVSIFRPGPGEWWYRRSSDGGNFAAQFGAGTDTIAPADYTGDGKTDIAFFRPSSGEWFVLRSEDNSFFSFPFGANGDIPVPGDYDGDGTADPAVFRPSSNTWFINNSGGGTTIQGFGIAGDQPVVADYDGDGKDDIAIYRPSLSEWWIDRSQDGLLALQFGASGDQTTPADFTSDGKADVAFFRPTTGEWFVLRSEDFSFF
ncbi:MAG: hypothetical protein HKN33_13745, partial [Pyrinomonadaceae bacterium]|nr:hypothetical protein [Pyrinomonadaceae bacterium]